MGPRLAGFFSGTLLTSTVGGYYMKEKVRRKIEFTDSHLQSYEKDVQVLQQRMQIVQRGFALLRRLQ